MAFDLAHYQRGREGRAMSRGSRSSLRSAIARLAVGALATALAIPVQAQAPVDKASKTGVLVFVGTRADGPGAGITALRFDPPSGRLTSLGLAVPIDRPTWLMASPHRSIIYSVSEIGNDGKSEAAVYSFAADPATGRLSQISKVRSGGGGATHLLLNAKTLPPAILVANYGGQVSVIPLGHDGVLSDPTSVQTDVGSGLLPRQSSAHPHGTAIDASGRFVFVADLGADRIFVYRYDPAGRTLAPADPLSVSLTPGSGPRHVIVHPNNRFVYVNEELTGDITLLAWEAAAARLHVVKDIPTRAKGYSGEISSAELMLSPDGRFLYASNRGEDDVIVYAVNPDNGDLKEVERLPSGGKAPVSFAEDPSGRWLLVANEESGTIAVFSIDPRSGRLTPEKGGLTLTRPTNIAFLPRRQ